MTYSVQNLSSEIIAKIFSFLPFLNFEDISGVCMLWNELACKYAAHMQKLEDVLQIPAKLIQNQDYENQCFELVKKNRNPIDLLDKSILNNNYNIPSSILNYIKGNHVVNGQILRRLGHKISLSNVKTLWIGILNNYDISQCIINCAREKRNDLMEFILQKANENKMCQKLIKSVCVTDNVEYVQKLIKYCENEDFSEIPEQVIATSIRHNNKKMECLLSKCFPLAYHLNKDKYDKIRHSVDFIPKKPKKLNFDA